MKYFYPQVPAEWFVMSQTSLFETFAFLNNIFEKSLCESMNFMFSYAYVFYFFAVVTQEADVMDGSNVCNEKSWAYLLKTLSIALIDLHFRVPPCFSDCTSVCYKYAQLAGFVT